MDFKYKLASLPLRFNSKLPPSPHKMASNPINVIIPMGGLGSRFSKNGYHMPKPLVNIMARPMISWLIGNLNVQPDDILHIAIQAQLDKEHDVCRRIRAEFPSLQIRFTMLQGLTRGAAETLYKVTEPLRDDELQRPTISLDCDTLYFSDVLHSFRSLQPAQGCCAYFEDTGNTPIFSYIGMKPQAEQRIHHIAEKVAISRHANTGAYGFPSATVLNRYVVDLLAKPLPSAGEFYTSALISSMIEDGIDFRGTFVPDFACVGTPPQLLSFFKQAVTRPKLIQSRHIALDLESVSEFRADTDVSDAKLLQHLSESVFRIMEEAEGVLVKVKFSLASGFVPKEDQKSQFYFLTVAERRTACEKGTLVPIDNGLEKAVGWYI